MREQYDYTICELCEAFEVSKSGYYAMKSATLSQRHQEETKLLDAIKAIHSHRHMRNYGSPRMTHELRSIGIACSENRIARIMSQHGIAAPQKAAFRPKTTLSDPANKASPNLLRKKEEPTSPGEIFVSDITYVATREGWLYLAVVIDLFSRSVAGWSIAEHMETSLVTTALDRATSRIETISNPIFHSDRGCQYTSKSFRKRLALLGFNQSMSALGYCYDNAKSESFFATIKRESFPDDCCFETKIDAQRAIFDYIETFYNRSRLHSSLGYNSPESHLRNYFQNQNDNLN